MSTENSFLSLFQRLPLRRKMYLKTSFGIFSAKRCIWAPRLVCGGRGGGGGTGNIFVMLLMYLWSPKHCICIVRYDVFVADPRHICRLITNGTRGGAAKRALGLPSYLWTQTPLRSRNLANKI